MSLYPNLVGELKLAPACMTDIASPTESRERHSLGFLTIRAFDFDKQCLIWEWQGCRRVKIAKSVRIDAGYSLRLGAI